MPSQPACLTTALAESIGMKVPFPLLSAISLASNTSIYLIAIAMEYFQHVLSCQALLISTFPSTNLMVLCPTSLLFPRRCSQLFSEEITGLKESPWIHSAASPTSRHFISREQILTIPFHLASPTS